jgi:heptosyltransferase-1
MSIGTLALYERVDARNGDKKFMKILIVKMSSMGDVIHTLPAITEAGKYIPNLQIDWVVEEGFAEIARWHPLVKGVIPIAVRRWRKTPFKSLFNKEVYQWFKQIRAKKYDLIIDAQGLVKSALVAWLAHGKRVGFNKNAIKEPLARYVYQECYAVPKDYHAIDRIKQLFSQALQYDNFSEINYGLDKKIFSVENTLKQQPYLFFIHATSADKKLWPEDQWIALVHLAAENGCPVKTTWGNAAEKARAERIAQACPGMIEVLPKMSLKQVATHLLGAKAVVAVDTGLGHLTAALDVPCISLYGPTNAQKIGTRGANQIHLLSVEKQWTDLSAERVWQTLTEII